MIHEPLSKEERLYCYKRALRDILDDADAYNTSVPYLCRMLKNAMYDIPWINDFIKKGGITNNDVEVALPEFAKYKKPDKDENSLRRDYGWWVYFDASAIIINKISFSGIKHRINISDKSFYLLIDVKRMTEKRIEVLRKIINELETITDDKN